MYKYICMLVFVKLCHRIETTLHCMLLLAYNEFDLNDVILDV